MPRQNHIKINLNADGTSDMLTSSTWQEPAISTPDPAVVAVFHLDGVRLLRLDAYPDGGIVLTTPPDDEGTPFAGRITHVWGNP